MPQRDPDPLLQRRIRRTHVGTRLLDRLPDLVRLEAEVLQGLLRLDGVLLARERALHDAVDREPPALARIVRTVVMPDVVRLAQRDLAVQRERANAPTGTARMRRGSPRSLVMREVVRRPA
jgi:hypothetical protein